MAPGGWEFGSAHKRNLNGEYSVIVFVLFAVVLAASLIKSRDKTKAAFVFAWKALLKTTPVLLGISDFVSSG